MSSRTASTIAAQGGPWAQLRTGTIESASGGTAVVVVGAASFEASIIVPFGIDNPGAAVPAPGTLVMVGRQDSSWAVLGSILGASGNLIENGSFEASIPESFPEGWTLFNITGVNSAVVAADISPVSGSNAAAITTTSNPGASYLYSSPVAVNAGDVLQLSAFAGADYEEGTAITADASIYALWFATDTDTYPTTSSADTLVDSANDIPQVPPWTPLSGSVTAPVTGYMRLALRSDITGDQTMYWDFAVVRRFT